MRIIDAGRLERAPERPYTRVLNFFGVPQSVQRSLHGQHDND